MNEFKTYHPLVNFIYFLSVIGFSMFFMHPVCLGISFLCSALYCFVLKGAKSLKTSIFCIVPMILTAAFINAAFNHEGVTVLRYFPNGNPLTLESVLYGFGAAVMIADVILWFSCFNEVMTSDKFVYLFGRIMPSLSLILSMTLRFVPRFKQQLKAVAQAQRGMGKDISKGNIISRAKSGLTILSAMVTWALEGSLDTADSMKARGYGTGRRTAFSIFSFDKRDGLALGTVIILSVYIMAGKAGGCINFRYFPSVKGAAASVWSISVFAAYFLLCLMPVLIELWEVRKWNALKSKI